MNTKDTGDKGEQLACEYLVNNGYKILGRNYRVNFGEIDIIAKKKGFFTDKTIHFVEVKTLFSGGAFYPEEHVNYHKKNKYRGLVDIWLNKNKYPLDTPCQVDVASVSIDGDDEKIHFFENVVEG
jgi:putative endonuclease